MIYTCTVPLILRKGMKMQLASFLFMVVSLMVAIFYLHQ